MKWKRDGRRDEGWKKGKMMRKEKGKREKKVKNELMDMAIRFSVFTHHSRHKNTQ